MRIAIIDLGTNSVRFDVHQVGDGRSVRTLYREKVMVRLGQGVFTDGQLDRSAVHRTIHAFSVFKHIAEELNVRRVVALGTSALREAADGEKFVNKIKKSTGIDVRVIPGVEEARLIALGILSNETPRKKTVGLVDIGGGSTEISICRQKKIIKSESFALGTARMQQVFLKSSPPSPSDIDRLRLYIRESVCTKFKEKNWPKVKEVIGSSGTIRALAKILKKREKSKFIERKALSALIKTMSRMTTTQLLGIEGMESKRVDMILAGAILLEECLLALGAEKVFPTEFALRDGILEEQIQLSRKHEKSQMALHIPDIIDKAHRFGLDRTRSQASAELANAIFDRLKKVHRIDPSYRIYLSAAMILRNCGEAISLIGHDEHSYYIVKNARFPFVDDWEAEFVAQLCLYHDTTKIDVRDLPFKKERGRRVAFVKLLALLSISDALDVDRKRPTHLKKIAISKKKIEMHFSSHAPGDIEVVRAMQRKVFFEKTFRRMLEVKKV